jgi:hypothetical protein
VSGNKTFRIKNYYERNIPLDDGLENDEPIRMLPIRIKRFSVTESQAFHGEYLKIVNADSARMITRRPDGEEQERTPTGTFVIRESEIRLRRLAEMTLEQRAAFDTIERADEDFILKFSCRAITQYVWLAPGVTLELETSGQEQTERLIGGAGLVKVFAGNISMLLRIVKAIHEENTLSPETKKFLRSLSGSTASSPPPPSEAADGGAKQAAAVLNAGTADSAPSGAVQEVQDRTPSGSILAAPM